MSGEGRSGEMSATQIPNNFRCPISLEKMTDPVMIPSGHTFDRSSIQKWLDDGNRTCPVTRVLLPDHFDLISNHSLRSVISDYTSAPASGTRPDPGPEPEPGALVAALASCSTPPESKRQTLARLIELSKDNPAFCRRLTESGIAAVVLSCVDSDNGLMRERALGLLLNLSIDDDSKAGLVKEGAISKIVGALTADSANCRTLAAEMISKLAAVEDNQATIGKNPAAISGLNSLLKDGSVREKEKAVMALLAICSSSENQKRVAANGLVPVLIKAADSGIECAVELLAKLVKLSKAREEMEERCDKCVRVLVQVLKNGNKRVQYALSTLHSLCCSSEKICVKVRKFGVLEMCDGFKEDNDKKIRAIAAGLANLLRSD